MNLVIDTGLVGGNMVEVKKCLSCQIFLKSTKSWVKYCSKKCRDQAYNKRHWQKYKEREKLRNKIKYERSKP